MPETVTDPEHRPLLDGLDPGGVRVLDTSTDEWRPRLDAATELTPHREVGPMDTYMMIFTSGTSGNPKAVQVSHFMVLMSGQALVERFSLTADDTCYVSMPLFHSNPVVAGWASRWRMSLRRRRNPTTQTIRCGSRSATRPATVTSTTSGVVLVSRCGTASDPPKTP
jgi:acyl-CoA synthetase (AMP-forming)/AMP-acid ligase II